MKNISTMLFKALAVTALLAGLSTGVFADGLLVIAHGSPDKKWNESVSKLEKDLRAELVGKGYRAVSVCFLETEPSIENGVKALEKAGVKHIFALPLFMAPSEHLNADIPAVLGLYYDPAIARQLKDEKISVVRSAVPITMGPPLMYGELLGKAMLRRVKELSRRSSDEAVIYLAHGSEMYEPLWNKMMDEIGKYVADGTGIASREHVFVEVGQSFVEKGVPAIEKALSAKPRVLVVSLYLGLGARGLYERSLRAEPDIKKRFDDLVKNDALAFSPGGILPDHTDLLLEWILQRARENTAFR